VQNALDRNALVADDSNVSVNTSGYTVTLSGHLYTWAERDAVVGAAWMADGVIQVHDDLGISADEAVAPSRSQVAFIRGAWAAVGKMVVPAAWKTASNEAVRLEPRSRTPACRHVSRFPAEPPRTGCARCSHVSDTPAAASLRRMTRRHDPGGDHRG
jgi:hypothetical protein